MKWAILQGPGLRAPHGEHDGFRESLLRLPLLLQKCAHTPLDVTDDEWERCSSFYFIVYNSWEYTYYQDGNDALPKGLHVGADAYFRGFLKEPGYRKFWPEYREACGEPFRSYVEEIFVATASTQSTKTDEGRE